MNQTLKLRLEHAAVLQGDPLFREARYRIEELESVIERYSWHRVGPSVCPAIQIPHEGPCTCGYDEAIARLI